MDYPVLCPTCGEGGRFRVDADLGGVPLWVCPEGHGTIRRAGSLPRPRRSWPADAPLDARPVAVRA